MMKLEFQIRGRGIFQERALKIKVRDFSGGPVVNTPSNARGVGFDWELRSHMPCSQKTKTKQYWNKFNAMQDFRKQSKQNKTLEAWIKKKRRSTY